jgi:uncharacterized membrane protein
MPSDPPSAAPRGDLPSADRLLALSDGVVAIALTLLVLQLAVPSPAKLADPNSASELARELGDGADRLISYLISFYVIAQFWLVHHRVFRRITGHHEGLAWWNFAFLLTITIMPFTSDLLGEYSGNPLAVDIFAANLLLATVATQLTLVYGQRKNLLTAETAQQTRTGQYRAAGSLLVVATSIGIAWVNPSDAKYFWLLLAVVPRVADRLSRRRSG